MLTPHFNDTHIPMTLLVALAYLWIREHQRCGDTSQISKTPSRQGLSNTTRFCAQLKTNTSNSHHFVSLSLSLSTSAVLTLSLSLSLSLNFRSIQVHGELRQCAPTPVLGVSQSEADWRRSAPPRPPRQSSPAAAELEPRPHLRDSCSCRASHCPARMAQLPWDQ